MVMKYAAQWGYKTAYAAPKLASKQTLSLYIGGALCTQLLQQVENSTRFLKAM